MSEETAPSAPLPTEAIIAPPLAGPPPPEPLAAEILPPLLALESVSPPPVAAPPVPEPAPETHPFIFHGEWREYFRIWIVNTLLTLLTLGVFVAWAKVRKRRYIRGNVELMGHRFDYRARPSRILVGNLVVGALFLAYSFVGKVYTEVAVGAVVIALLMLPWIVVRSLAFNAHNTTYRGLKFYFHQTYGAGAMLFFGQGLVVALTLGLYYPAWMRNRREFTVSNHRLGDAFFRFTGKNGPFYRAYLIAAACMFGAIIAGAMIAMLLSRLNDHAVPTLVDQIPFFALYGTAFWFCRSFLYAELFRYGWNHTQLDGHRFVATLDTGHWIRLQFVNLGAVIISCGLLHPWATIRNTRYALSCLRFQPAGPIEKIGALGRAEGNALGDSAGEFIGMDFGL